MTISLSDFKNLSEKDQKKTLENLKKEIGVSGIVKEWNVSRSKVYSMLRQYNIAVGSKHKLKPQKPHKTSAESPDNNDTTRVSTPADQPSPAETAETSNRKPLPSSLSFAGKDDAAKFSLYLETQGTASFINETVQMLLGSQKFADSNLQVNISLQEI